MKKVKCKSGMVGWQCRLRDNYSSYEEFIAYDGIFGIAQRLGFTDAHRAWYKNPMIQGSTDPSDLCVVKIKNKKA